MAAVDGQPGDGVGVVCGVGESSAGADLGELVVVASEEHSAAVVKVCRDDLGERADISHACFVDHEKGARLRTVGGALVAGEEAVQRGGRHARRRGEFEGGTCGWCCATHRDAGGFVNGADGVDGVRLAGAGGPDEHAHRAGRGAQGLDSMALVSFRGRFDHRGRRRRWSRRASGSLRGRGRR